MAKPRVVIPEAFNTYGWYQFEICTCGGILTYKFRHMQKNGLQVNWRVYYYDFKVMNRNSTKVGVTKIGKLEEILKSL